MLFVKMIQDTDPFLGGVGLIQQMTAGELVNLGSGNEWSRQSRILHRHIESRPVHLKLGPPMAITTEQIIIPHPTLNGLQTQALFVANITQTTSAHR
jgi:hypothetical protein